VTDRNVADGVGVAGEGRLHRPVGGHDVGAVGDNALLQQFLPEDLARAARFVTGEDVDGRIAPADSLPVGNLAGENLLNLHGGQSGHRVLWTDHCRHAVDGEGKRLEPVLGNFRVGQCPPGVADIDETLADLLHADTRATGRDGDANRRVRLHDALGRSVHHRNVRRAAGNVDLAILAGE
jgi:hypothetical protein